jgi:hypothetical protein
MRHNHMDGPPAHSPRQAEAAMNFAPPAEAFFYTTEGRSGAFSLLGHA